MELETVPLPPTHGNLSAEVEEALGDFIDFYVRVKIEYPDAPLDITENYQKGIHPIIEGIYEENEDSVGLWIRNIKAQRKSVDETDVYGLNALHYAILFRKEVMVKIIIDSGAGLTVPATKYGFLPLQLAIIGPRPINEDVVNLLCPIEVYVQTDPSTQATWNFSEDSSSHYSPKDVVNFSSSSSFFGTALHFAIYIRSEEAVDLLMKKGANPVQCWKNQTPLGRAIEIREQGIVETLLGMEDGVKQRDALKCVSICKKDCSSEAHGHHPFNELITAYPDLARTVMDYCIHTKHAPHEEDYEIMFDCSLFENGTVLNKCTQGLPCTCWDFIRDTRQSSGCHDFLNFRGMHTGSFEKIKHPLYCIMRSGHRGLFQHPLSQALLKYKLSIFFWTLYFLNFSSYLFLIAFLVAFILLVPHPNLNICRAILNGTVPSNTCTQLFFSATTRNTVCQAVFDDIETRHATFEDHFSPLGYWRSLLTFQILTLVLILIRALAEVYQIYHQKVLNYFFSWENWLEISQCLSTTIFLFSVTRCECFCPSLFAWKSGIVSLALSCLVLILWLETLPVIGVYVIIMKKIVNSFLKLSLLGILLVAAFGMSFYMLFYVPTDRKTISTYGNPLRAMLAVIPLTAGDISLDGVFYSSTERAFDGDHQYEALALAIWLFAVIIMTIIFSNMLVGLAVGEVGEVVAEAKLTEMKRKIDLVLTLEENIPRWLHQLIAIKEPLTVKPNISVLKKVLKKVLSVTCMVFSVMCCNTYHMRYWYWFYQQPPKQKDHIQQITSIVERTRLFQFESKQSHQHARQASLMDELL